MISLDGFLEQIGQAGQAAQGACVDEWMRRLEKLCEPVDPAKPDGPWVPKCITVDVAGQPVKVPLISLYGLHHLTLGTVRIEFESDISLEDMVAKKVKTHNPIKLLMQRGVGDNATTVKVEAEFHSHEPNEAMKQIQDRLTRHLTAALKEKE